MTSKVLKLASLALVAGFMTSSIDVMGMNENTEVNENNGRQTGCVAEVKLGESLVPIHYNFNDSMYDIYNIVCPKCKEVIQTDDEFLQQSVELFAKFRAEFYATKDEMFLGHVFCALFGGYSVMKFDEFEFCLGMAGRSNDKLVINQLYISMEGDLSIEQQLYNAIKNKVIQELDSNNAETTKNRLAECQAFNLACQLQNRASQIKAKLDANPMVAAVCQIYH